jgi:hypothetical protein
MPARILLAFLVTSLTASEAYCPWWPAVERWGIRPKQIEYQDSFRRSGIHFTVESKYRMIAAMSGKDSDGKPWTLQLGPVGMGDQQLYAGDFDHNGREDYLIATDTGAVGMAAPSWTQFVMLASDGRPVPWLRRGYADPRKIRFSDFNRDGRLEWTDTRYGASNRDQHNYWTSTLYEARDAHWHPVTSPHGGVVSPQFTQYNHEANRRPFPLTESEKPPVENLGSAPTWEEPVAVTHWQPGQPRTAEFQYPRKGLADHYFQNESRESPQLTLSNGETCFLSSDAETIRETPRTIAWIEPTKQAIADHPLHPTITRHQGRCRIERIVIHAR